MSVNETMAISEGIKVTLSTVMESINSVRIRDGVVWSMSGIILILLIINITMWMKLRNSKAEDA